MDGVWELRIDRSGGSDDPEEAFNFLPEAYYHPIEDGHVYRVLVSEQGARVSIEGTWAAAQIVVKGERTSTTDGRTLYGLNDLAGGGRFVVWRAAEGLQGEFTVYGSGMPILSSERGALIRDTSANGAPTTVTSALLYQEETARAEAALLAFFEAWVAKDLVAWKALLSESRQKDMNLGDWTFADLDHIEFGTVVAVPEAIDSYADSRQGLERGDVFCFRAPDLLLQARCYRSEL
jgi:hypothetical protein